MNPQSNILLLNPCIANAAGVNESIVLQQLYYWHQKYSFQKWIYNSYEDWQKQFSFWSVRTIRRIFTSLESQGLIISKRSKSCKFYRLCEDTIKKFFINQDRPNSPSKMAKLDHSINRETKNTQIISSYKKKLNIKPKKFVTDKHLITIKNSQETQNLEELTCIANRMKDAWNEVFQYSLNPTKAYTNKSIIIKLNYLYQNKFHSDIKEWISYAKKVNSSKFLMGEKETKNSFKAVFAWLIKEEVIDSILEGAYGVGDRELDMENLDQNIKIQETEVKQQMNNKIAQYLEQNINKEKEEKEFKIYIMEKQYEKDNDKYRIKQHMEEIGRFYMYGGYITPSHIYYPGNENYRKKIYNSYLMAKYFNIDEISLDKKMKKAFNMENNNIKLFQDMKEIKRKIKDLDLLTNMALIASNENSMRVIL